MNILAHLSTTPHGHPGEIVIIIVGYALAAVALAWCFRRGVKR